MVVSLDVRVGVLLVVIETVSTARVVVVGTVGVIVSVLRLGTLVAVAHQVLRLVTEWENIRFTLRI